MRIEHLAMYVKDLELNKQFYIDFFQATANEMYHNPATGLRTYFLSFEQGPRLELMNRPEMTEAEQSLTRTGLIHFAFSAGSRPKVDELTLRLKEAGYKVLSGPRTTGDGYYESCILGPEGSQIEITE
ncbi:VOC family protein [Paenibacillus sp. MMS20-IR301]|uniref:VOC family protein n=1 Tax=Paenibacillus sp. MMS20-IR301 TaxID=2895946 RepID=UPI0028EF839B|nr:VOC family protein [Paenibacillus sp. MMS20-IR301]WNS45267.1 VOC family protein [Paenibacillus sp. MMS20-IR301]